MPDVANGLHTDAAHLRQEAVAQAPKFGERDFDSPALVGVRPAQPVLLIAAEREPERVFAASWSDLSEDVP
jgi:hypothetical protein